MFSSMEIWESSESEYENTLNLKITRRKLREKHNPLDLSNIEFQKRYRISKDAFTYILAQINLNEGTRQTFIPPVQRLAAALQILGSGSYQWGTSNDFMVPMGQSTLSNCLKQVVNEMEKILCPLWITDIHEEETKKFFYTKYGIPGVVGCIDGTHVYILKPKEDEHLYINRKGRHSLNVMVVCDYLHRISSICARFPGAAHDSFVWDQSKLKKEFEEARQLGQKNSWLLGDSGYGLEPWLMVPYRNPQPHSGESRFNEIFAKARANIEMCLGQYKGRWRILMDERKARYSPKKVATFANVCAALHNICVFYKVPFNPINLAEANDPNLDVDFEESRTSELRNAALKIRDKIKRSILGT